MRHFFEQSPVFFIEKICFIPLWTNSLHLFLNCFSITSPFCGALYEFPLAFAHDDSRVKPQSWPAGAGETRFTHSCTSSKEERGLRRGSKSAGRKRDGGGRARARCNGRDETLQYECERGVLTLKLSACRLLYTRGYVYIARLRCASIRPCEIYS